jgi:hypothetical protein
LGFEELGSDEIGLRIRASGSVLSIGLQDRAWIHEVDLSISAWFLGFVWVDVDLVVPKILAVYRYADATPCEYLESLGQFPAPSGSTHVGDLCRVPSRAYKIEGAHASVLCTPTCSSRRINRVHVVDGDHGNLILG